MNKIRMLFGLFTTIPMGRFEFTEQDYKSGLLLLPLIGIVLSTILIGVYNLLPLSLIRALVLLFLYIFLTGGLHLDGFGDTLDGILSRREPERMLEIMKDSRVGTFALVGIVILLLTYYSTLAEASLGLMSFPLIGRLGAMVSTFKHTYARKEGMGKLFLEINFIPSILFSIVSLVIFYLLIHEWIGLVAMIVSILSVIGTTVHINKAIGGMTGDTIGFSIEFTQMVFLIIYSIGNVL